LNEAKSGNPVTVRAKLRQFSEENSKASDRGLEKQSKVFFLQSIFFSEYWSHQSLLSLLNSDHFKIWVACAFAPSGLAIVHTMISEGKFFNQFLLFYTGRHLLVSVFRSPCILSTCLELHWHFNFQLLLETRIPKNELAVRTDGTKSFMQLTRRARLN
jgi:hypothetical protein